MFYSFFDHNCCPKYWTLIHCQLNAYSLSILITGIIYKLLTNSHLRLASKLNINKEKVEASLEAELKSLKSNNYHEIVSTGERLISVLLKEYFSSSGLNVDWTTGYDLGVEIKDDVISRDCSKIVKKNLLEKFFEKEVTPIVTGFDGGSNGRRLTLRRSGSDQTATFLSYSLDADFVYLIKNSRGIETADPKIVKNTRNIPSLNYDMAMESSNIQFEALQYVKEKEIPLVVQYIEDPKIKTIVDKNFKSSGIEFLGSGSYSSNEFRRTELIF